MDAMHRGVQKRKPAAASFVAKPRVGRPRKFSRPSSAVTLTLPDDVMAMLHAIDADLSRAVVRVVQRLAPKLGPGNGTLTTLGDRGALILLPPSRTLREHTGVELIPLADGRAMLSFPDTMSLADFELRLRDALAHAVLPAVDRSMFEELSGILRAARRGDGVAVSERRILLLRWTHASAGNGTDGPLAR